jgi:uncharacterized membrane protein YedE/YeeE
MEYIMQPWPWWVTGPLIGLILPAMLMLLRKPLSISSSFQDVCAATIPGGHDYFAYEWRANAWRFAFVIGIVVGGGLAWNLLTAPETHVAISEATRTDLLALGIVEQSGLVPSALMSWRALGTLPGFVIIVGGGFLVGFGARYADGCTSGHAITGLANLQLPSLLAVVGFFVGGLLSAHVLLPALLGGLQ